MTDAKPTPGPAWIEDHANGVLFVTSSEAPIGDICDFYHRAGDEIVRKERHEGEALANANLFKDAIDTHHETGLTPRQLAEQWAELLELMESIENDSGYIPAGFWNRMQAAIATARGSEREGGAS
jgi:hypothetical protein